MSLYQKTIFPASLEARCIQMPMNYKQMCGTIFPKLTFKKKRYGLLLLWILSCGLECIYNGWSFCSYFGPWGSRLKIAEQQGRRSLCPLVISRSCHTSLALPRSDYSFTCENKPFVFKPLWRDFLWCEAKLNHNDTSTNIRGLLWDLQNQCECKVPGKNERLSLSLIFFFTHTHTHPTSRWKCSSKVHWKRMSKIQNFVLLWTKTQGMKIIITQGRIWTLSS